MDQSFLSSLYSLLSAPLVAWTAVATDFALAWAVLFLRPRPRVEVSRVLLAFAALGLWVGFKCIVALMSSEKFLVVHLVYLDAFVLLPGMGLLLLLLHLRRRVELARSVHWASVASLALIPIGFVATFVEPYRLVTERTSVPLARARAGTDPILIGVLADIQCTKVTDHERDAVARIVAAKPDLILIPGDLVQVGTHELPELQGAMRELLAPLDAPLGVYFVQGNCESMEKARRLLEGTRVRVLDNEIVELVHGDRRITLCGVELVTWSPRARAALERIEGAQGSDDVRIVVAHYPDVIYGLSVDSRVDLVVAGHTHGGQVQIPFFGPPITLAEVPRRIGAGGLNELDGRRIYVSRGLGWEHGFAPRVRFLCPPEVSLLRLETEGSVDASL
jgi:predicted MPP superfamily phosphohydrolase